ncbi:MAG: 3-hydroxyacyl-CoA dehydrogenase NAD-binding domain-containing protein [Schleiferiaceae bacterium]|nr:3-hydroxyacyl-CoA dehydrogenase NAD-binding domain-containing protein [Schleiferiaceae bacterium]
MTPTKISIATVVGAGAMGSGIAQVLAQAGVNVKLYDTKEEALNRAMSKLKGTMDRLLEKGKVQAEEAAGILSRIQPIVYLREAADSDLVIEAIYESLEAKRSVFTTLDDVVGADCILATNTSSLSVAAISSGVKNPKRLIGLHFFNPAPLMPLVEIVPSLATDPEVLRLCVQSVKDWGKIGVIAKDSPGFIVNRVARPFYAEAMNILEEGLADVSTIDWAMTELGGFRMGPFALMDLIGHDVNYTVTETVWTQFYYDPRFRPNLSQKRLVEAGWLGKKTGRGFYDYRADAPALKALENRDKGKKILYRILSLLINEAADAIYRSVTSPADLETAMTKGVNYPKGLLAWGSEWGFSKALQILDDLQKRTGDPRYRACPLLRDWAIEAPNFTL